MFGLDSSDFESKLIRNHFKLFFFINPTLFSIAMLVSKLLAFYFSSIFSFRKFQFGEL